MTSPAAASSRRAVFLDLDGTYAHHGVVPPEHVAAVRRARAAGHLVLLCTGRPLSLLHPRVLTAGFDGIIGGAGAYVAIGDRVLRDVRFPAALTRHTVATLDAHQALYMLEAPEATHALPSTIAALRRGMLERGDGPGARDIVEALRPTQRPHEQTFTKVAIYGAASPLGVIAAALGPEVAAIPSSIPELGEGAGELYLSDIHKATGMEVALAHLGLSAADAIAFGDGLNDVEMLAYAGIGVAIEGARPEVIAAADRVARGPLVAGLAEAFAELELLGG